MIRMFKTTLKALWRLTDPIRRPFRKKLEGMLNETIVNRLDHANHRLETLHHDVNLALNSTVREIARLQMQIEILQQMIEDSTTAAEPYHVVADPEGDAPSGNSTPRHSKAS